MIPTSVQLTEEQVQPLKLLANKEHVSTAELVRRAIAAAGSFRSGYYDISERHDDYLAEDFGA